MQRFLHCLFLISFLSSCQKNIDNKDTRYTYELSRLKVEYINARAKLIEDISIDYNGYGQLIENLANTVQSSFLSLAKESWPTIYGKYIQLHPYSYSNPIIQSDLNLIKENLDVSNINESYIDYTAALPNSGIINNAGQYPNLFNISSFHQVGDVKNASLGFHVIEFLLWGEDTNLLGDTERSINEFSNSSPSGARRREFIQNCSYRLRQDLLSLASFDETNEALKKVSAQDFIPVLFDPVIHQLDELAETVIKKPYDSQNKRDVICPPSDKSNEIILEMINSVSSYLDPYGENSSVNEYSIMLFIQEGNVEMSDIIKAKLIEAENNILDLSMKFEDAISDGGSRLNILAAYNAIVSVKNLLIEFKADISI